MMEKAAKVAPPVPMDEHNRRQAAANAPPKIEQTPAMQSGWAVLSAREQQVLMARSTGATLADVAAELSLTVSTIKQHQTSANRKLGTSNLPGALLEAGILVPNPMLDA